MTYPDGTVHPPEGLWSFGGPVTWGAQFGHPEWNTRIDPTTGDPVVPWAGTTFTLDPLSPLTNYFAHLMSDPNSPDNTIKIPTPEQISTAVTTLAEGLFVAFSPFYPGSPWCLGLCGPPTDMKPPFFWDTLPPWLSTPATTTASLDQNSASVGANAESIPQGSDVQQSGGVAQNGALRSEADQQNNRVQQNEPTQNGFVNLSTAKSVEESTALQKVLQTAAAQTEQRLRVALAANGTSNQSTATSTNPSDVAKERRATDDGSKSEPRHVSGNGTPRGGSAGAPNARLDRPGSSRSANPSTAANDDSTSTQPGDGGGEK